MSDGKDNINLVVHPNTSTEFNAISPLEPLDPNKFRNIMLDKHESQSRYVQANEAPQQSNKSHQLVNNATSDYPNSNIEMQAKRPEIADKAYPAQQMMTPFIQPQNPNSQYNLHGQQNFSHQQSMLLSPQKCETPYSAMQQSTSTMCGSMLPVAQNHMFQQQQSHPNYSVQAQQWQPQQSQLYHAFPGRICSPHQQHNSITLKQIPAPPYNVADTTPIIQYPQLPSQTVQRQMSNCAMPRMSHQPPHPQNYSQPGYLTYGFGGESRQHDFGGQSATFIQSPTQVKRNSSEHLRQPQQNYSNQKRPQVLRMPLSVQHQSQFFGHDPTIASKINPDVCLAGCVFLLADDCSSHFVDYSLLPSMVRFYGGDVESNNPRGIPDRVTHIICSNWMDNEPLMQQALSPSFNDHRMQRKKRVITISWLNDIIEKGRIEPPTKASHLPCFWSALKPNPNVSSKIISISGFNQADSNSLRYMIELIGARFCPLSSSTNYLVLNRDSIKSESVQKACENGVTLVDYKWLFELYFGNLSTLEVVQFSPESEGSNGIILSTQYLAKISEFCHKLMLPWTQPIVLDAEIIKAAYEVKRNVSNDTNIFPEKLFSFADDAPSEDQIKQSSSLITAFGRQNKVSVLIEGFLPEQCDKLSKKVRFLGGEFTRDMSECTHFVCPNLRKSVNLVEAIARGKNVVTPLWIESSFKKLDFIDPYLFFVRDRENERKLGFNLKSTILHARNKRVFQDIAFHISNGVQPTYKTIKALVESAGGQVRTQKPKKKELLQCCIQNNTTYFIICNRNDIGSYRDLVACNFPLFNEDFVIMSILRHKIDLSDEFHTSSVHNLLPIMAGNNSRQA